MGNRPFVSVIIVSYNCAAVVRDALDGCKAQTYADFEVVLVDNGSTDNTLDVVKKFTADHPNIAFRLVRIEHNTGLPRGRNAGLDAATGEYVMFNDADDWMNPDCLDRLTLLASETDADRVMSPVNTIREDGVPLETYPLAVPSSRWMKPGLQGDIFRRSIFVSNNIRFSENAYYDDFYITSEFNSHAQKEAFCYQVVYNMRIRASSMTHESSTHRVGYFPVRFESTLASMADIMPRLVSPLDKTLYEYVCIQKYYTSVFAGVHLSYSDKVREYCAFKRIMRKHLPDYLKNQNIRLIRFNYFAGHFKRNIWVAAMAERLDDLCRGDIAARALLLVYHLSLRLRLYEMKS